MRPLCWSSLVGRANEATKEVGRIVNGESQSDECALRALQSSRLCRRLRPLDRKTNKRRRQRPASDCKSQLSFRLRRKWATSRRARRTNKARAGALASGGGGCGDTGAQLAARTRALVVPLCWPSSGRSAALEGRLRADKSTRSEDVSSGTRKLCERSKSSRSSFQFRSSFPPLFPFSFSLSFSSLSLFLALLFARTSRSPCRLLAANERRPAIAEEERRSLSAFGCAARTQAGRLRRRRRLQ